MSKNIPKYKSIPIYALRYAKRKGIKLSPEHERVFSKNIECAIEYAISIKKERLIEEVENKVLEFYCTKKYEKRCLSISTFYKYLNLVKTIPKKYEADLLENLDPESLVAYSKITGKRLEEHYEKKLLQHSISNKKLAYLVEYSYAIGSKLPEDMHNYLLLCYMNDKGKNKDGERTHLILESYFLNLKNIKFNLQKLSQVFNKNQTIEEIMNQL
jgi:hypothetical protein